jgi:uncharacterized protein
MHGPRILVSLAVLALLAALGPGCGCNKPATPEPSPSMTPDLPTRAQPKLQTLKLWLGAEEMVTELALTPEQVQTGMMFRTNMAENESMLFVFNQPHQARFWMKNCPLPLSAAYIDPDGVILEIRKLEPHNTNEVVAETARVQYVLETRQGWFERHNIRPGAVVRTERGSLQDTFFRTP